MNLLLKVRIDHLYGSQSMRAGKTGRGAEQATDERALSIDLAAAFTQMGTAKIGQSRFVNLTAFNRQS